MISRYNSLRQGSSPTLEPEGMCPSERDQEISGWGLPAAVHSSVTEAPWEGRGRVNGGDWGDVAKATELMHIVELS